MKARSVVVALTVALFIFVSAYPSLAQSPGPGSCVNCHTDESKLKSLFKAPVAGSQEGEG